MSLSEAIKEAKMRSKNGAESTQRQVSAEELRLADDSIDKSIRRGKTLDSCRAMLEESSIERLFAEADTDYLYGSGKVIDFHDVRDKTNGPGYIDSVVFSNYKRLDASGKGPRVRLLAEACIIEGVARKDLTDEEQPYISIACFVYREKTILERIFKRDENENKPSSSYRYLRQLRSEMGNDPIKEWQDVGKVKACLAEVLVEQGLV